MIQLFYSYSHKDESFREDMEKCLSVLRQNGLIHDWHDRKICPGQVIQREIDANLEDADIILLLLSADFLASSECQKEITTSLRLRDAGRSVVVPIILRPCPWLDQPGISRLLALPTDGKAVTTWADRDEAFLTIYQGIATTLRAIPFSLRESLREQLTEIEFISQGKDDARLDDVFVFPSMAHNKEVTHRLGTLVKSFSELLSVGAHVLLRGDDRSGKTVVCRKLFLYQVDNRVPALLLQGSEIGKRSNYDRLIQAKFEQQFRGEYRFWNQQANKTLIVDDFTGKSPLQFIDYAKEHFDRIVLSVSEEEYISYFLDETKLASFEILALQPLSHIQQEVLIRKWRTLGVTGEAARSITDGIVDQIEDRVNHIIIHRAIVPRYSFYVLSILQVYEAFMPQGLQITAYGHCYQSLITANLVWTGIHGEDIDSALNFLGCLAFAIFEREDRRLSMVQFDAFVKRYRDRYVIKDSVVSRLTGQARSIVRMAGDTYTFRYPFAYYYFLGQDLARNYEQRRGLVERLAEEGHLRENSLALIFLVHHAQDEDVVDVLLARSFAVLEDADVATLSSQETGLLEGALQDLPKQLVANRTVGSARADERARRDRLEGDASSRGDEGVEKLEALRQLIRSWRMMEVLGQVLRNKYGSLSRAKLGEMVQAIGNAGLRLMRVVLSKDRIYNLENFFMEKARDTRIAKDDRLMIDYLRKRVRMIVVLVILELLDHIGECIRKPELQALVRETCEREHTTAYDMIWFLFRLKTAGELTQADGDELEALLEKFGKERNAVAERLVSMFMEKHLGTHEVEYGLRQRVYQMLDLPYTANPR